MKLKKSFTLIEIIVSISLFSIIIIFLYSTLNITQKSNNFFKTQLNSSIKDKNIKLLIFQDFVNSSDIKIYPSKNKNNILAFETTNTYHNSFFTNITYILTKQNNLVRIESNIKYDKKNQQKYLDNENKYIDIIKTDVKNFRVYKHKNKNIYTIEIISNNKTKKRVIITLNTV